MALGQIQDRKRIAFEGDYQLLSFVKKSGNGDIKPFGSYELMTPSFVTLNLPGWIDSGCEHLEVGKWYHFYFEYVFYGGKVKVRVIGVNPDVYTDIKVKEKKEPIEMNL